ncbi:muts domain V-domain-containing protein [Fomitopsis serialis]|uniref:muts domain V-domain-containing protein n=1 Tax=Fomitopsis serialis TaxID=139415 RepID=UPI0020073260|nr:muts domain V-domain-containing protein [Neoantrodia serialis]KAH9923367.1 muts domain V-domain-containing protein [Neoantrodia serialis]
MSEQLQLTTAWNSSSRPATGTGRPQTAVSSRHEASYVVSVLEGRGVAREVGIAALEKDTGRVSLIQLADSPTYIKTLHQLHLHSPSLILVPDTFLSMSDVSLASGGKKPSTTSVLEVLERTAGLDFITQLIVEGDERAGTIVAASTKYYALSAASALFKHAESRLNIRFASASLLIRFGQADGTMMIDPETSRNLELVGNMSSKKSTHSLFGLMNHTYTAMGARLLRVNILAPNTVQGSIEARLDAVEELVQNEDRFNEVKNALKALNKMDFDKLICSLAASEARESDTAKPAAARVSQMLNLRNIVKTMPLLSRALGGCRSQLLSVIAEMVSDERLAKIERLVTDSLNEAATPAKAGLGALNARVYAVKANCNRLLDVARETYKENLGDIFTLNRDLSERHNLPLSLVYQDTGFVFALKKNELEGELPKGFINVTIQKGRWLFSSIEMKKRNARMKDALDESLILSNKIIQDLATEVVIDIGALYKASEAVAILDMLWSFAHVSILRNYVRPEFTGTLAIKAGRHPILETVQSAGTLVPNDVYCSEAASFQIVQGPNMSGKSTYLRQIGLLTVMAMSGCFVPAEYGSFKLHDALLSRLSNDDDMEKSLSTFANEMASCAMILGLATADSLVMMDEVGRGTSPREGMGVAHAIAEELIRAKSYVFFATHFTELTVTLSHKPSVVNLHLAVQRARRSTTNFGLTFQYKIVDGASDDIKHYGLELARLADLPEDVLDEGRRVALGLQSLQERQQQDSQTNKVAIRRKALLRVLRRI